MDKSIIHGCIDFLKDYDISNPCPSHKAHINKWIEDFDEALTGTIPPCDEIDMASYSEDIQNVFTLFLSKAHSDSWGKLSVEERQRQIGALLDTLQVQQRSPAWYAQSKTVLTASEFSNILGTPRSIANLALKKAAPVSEIKSDQACATGSMSAFDWGIRFEPVVKQVLTAIWDCDIAEVGRFIHPTDPRLAASPDGIILKAIEAVKVGRLLEIKCPVRREINGKIPFEYWCQMQIQMEVTGIDECEYVEMKLASPYKDSQGYAPATEGIGSMYLGKIWLFQCVETCELKYAYTYLEKKDMERLEWTCLEEIPWHLEKYFVETVVRDTKWFEGTKPRQEEFWLRVADAHKGLIEPPKRRVKAPIVQVCQIMDDVA